MPTFIPGAELATSCYHEIIAPLLQDVPHSAGLLGSGSDVLGYDTERSTDHGWGPRCTVLVGEDAAIEPLRRRIEAALPPTFRGWPTRYGWDGLPEQAHIIVEQLAAWTVGQLGLDPEGELDEFDWLLLPQQRLLEVVAGPVFHDGLGRLEPLRTALRWYPDDVWRWLIGAQWQRISQEEAFVGRAAEVGDELGSALVASRLVREVMRLCFLLERCYAPYAKWFGTAFAALPIAGDGLRELLHAACTATDFVVRERSLTTAYRAVAEACNRLELADHVDPSIRSYHSRPFQVIHAERFAAAFARAQPNAVLRALPPVGAIDQWVDSSDVLAHPDRCRRLHSMLMEPSASRPHL